MFEPAVHERMTKDDSELERCDYMTSNGQCPYKRVAGTNRCEIHAYHNNQQTLQTQARRIYLAAQWAAQTGPFETPEQVKNLREEIGILKLTLMKIMQSCKSDQDLLMRSSSISELVVKIGKVVETAHKMDLAYGKLLDKEHLTAFGTKVIDLVSQFIKDPDVLKKFAHALVDEIKRTGTEERQ